MQDLAGNQSVIVERSALTGSYIKTGLFLLVSMLVVVGNFFLESKLANGGAVDDSAFGAFDFEKDNLIPKNGFVRFDKEKSAGENSMKKIYSSSYDHVFEFSSGKFWGNFSVSDAKVNIVHKNVVFIPNRAIFDLTLNDERLELNVYDGDVYLGFLPDDVKVTSYLDPFSDLFMNRMLVPRDNQVTIPLKKVNENIRPLLYSKLVKEFKYAFVPESLKDSEWAKQNTVKDKQAIESLKQKFSADVIYDGVKVQDGLLSNFIFWSEENLTFAPGKNREKIFEHLFAFLDDAIFYLNNGDSVSSDQFLADFDAYLATLPVAVTQSDDYYAKLDHYVNKLTIFKQGDSQYKILKFVLDKKFYAKRDIYNVVNSFWLNVYDGIDRGDSAAEEALNDYYKYFSAAGDIFADGHLYRIYLSYQNQLFDNLLLKSPVFYRDGYFAIKTIFEDNLLKSYEDGALKGELKQAFLSNKIDFMKRLKKFFFEGKLEVKEAREIFKRLFREISDLMPKDQDLAVIELFESQLADMNDFFGYLSTPEYQAKLYGATHEERFKAYLEERSTIWSFINIKEDVLGESTQKEKISVVEVVDQVEEDFKKYEDISDFEIGKIEDVDQRFVNVKLVLGGYPVSASYDRDNGTLKDIYVYEELISESAVKIDNLLSVLQEKFADLANEVKAEDEDEVTLETSAKRYARVYIAKKVAEYGFSATMENVSVVDELNAVYRVENVTLKEKPDLKITFDIAMGDELVTNVLLSVKGKPKVLDGKYSLEEFAAIVVAESELSVEKTPKKILR